MNKKLVVVFLMLAFLATTLSAQTIKVRGKNAVNVKAVSPYGGIAFAMFVPSNDESEITYAGGKAYFGFPIAYTRDLGGFAEFKTGSTTEQVVTRYDAYNFDISAKIFAFGADFKQYFDANRTAYAGVEVFYATINVEASGYGESVEDALSGIGFAPKIGASFPMGPSIAFNFEGKWSTIETESERGLQGFAFNLGVQFNFNN